MEMTSVLKLDTYECKLVFVVTGDLQKKVKNIYKKYNIIQEEEVDAEAIMISPTMSVYYIIIDIDYLTHNTVAHELFHVVNSILQDRDIHDEETGAWLSGHISNFIYNSVNKKKLTISNG